MKKNIAIGRLGLTIKFTGIKIGTQTACDTDRMIYSTLSQMNPDFNFYFIGPSDLHKLTKEEYDKEVKKYPILKGEPLYKLNTNDKKESY